jgi:Ca-activated chloride channel family protein
VTETGFHFAEPLWLWAMLLPVFLWSIPGMRRSGRLEKRLSEYADPHLLPHLIVQDHGEAPGNRTRLTLWTLLWLLAALAMAGPRWDYTDIDLFRPSANVVILLDLSRSMEVDDVRPTRLARAKQEIGDLLDQNPGMRVGLIAFASIAHVVTPLTEDAKALHHLLPSLSTGLLRFPGSRLSDGLERARRLLSGQPAETAKAVVLITDGDLPEKGLEEKVAALRKEGIRLHVLGVGTTRGGQVPLPQGGWMRSTRGVVVSRLDEGLLQALASAGGGLYRRADYLDDDTGALIDRILGDARPAEVEEGARRIWNERYPWLVGLLMVMMLVWFRRGSGVGRMR